MKNGVHRLDDFKPIKTADGSYTLHNPFYDEAYHSYKAGAVKECLHKFLYPSKILQKAKEKKRVSIVEVGFGLGFNCAITIVELLKEVPTADIYYIGLDKEIIPFIEELKLPEPYSEVYEFLKEKILKTRKGSEKVSTIEFRYRNNVKIKIILGDARETIKLIPDNFADAVYHDPFSPKKNPELWTYEFLKEEKRILKPDGWWVSYSCARKVRENLKKLGFRVFDVEPIGRRGPSTSATPEDK